jgi:hypothetical protein
LRLVLIFATVLRVLDLLEAPFAQRGLAAVAVLAVAAGLVGTWIVLRGLAFYAHAVGTATFPGLVLADGLGFAAGLGAAGAALLVAAGVGLLARSDRARDRSDSITALVLAGALALGVILASDVFASRASVDGLSSARCCSSTGRTSRSWPARASWPSWRAPCSSTAGCSRASIPRRRPRSASARGGPTRRCSSSSRSRASPR